MIECITDRIGNCPSYKSRVEPFIDSLPIKVVSRPKSNKIWIHRILAQYDSIVYDYDDGIHLLNEKLFEQTIKRTKTVLAGCDVLADVATSFGAKDVRIWRTGVNTDLYKVNIHEGKNSPLVWTGSSSTLQYLKIFSETIEKSKSMVRVICDARPTWGHTQFVPWSVQTQTSGLLGCSIGLAPLPDNDWTRCKCAFKVIQYMAAGLPVVSSSVGANKEIFEQYGCQGVCAKTEKEFLDGIIWLQNNPEERQRMGNENRRIAEKFFDFKILSKTLKEALRL
jgi:hypothetical protein